MLRRPRQTRNYTKKTWEFYIHLFHRFRASHCLSRWNKQRKSPRRGIYKGAYHTKAVVRYIPQTRTLRCRNTSILNTKLRSLKSKKFASINVLFGIPDGYVRLPWVSVIANIRNIIKDVCRFVPPRKPNLLSPHPFNRLI